MGLRLIRGDIRHVHADVYVVSSSGGFGGGASRGVLEGVRLRVGSRLDLDGYVAAVRDAVPDLAPGDAAAVTLPETEQRMVCAHAQGDPESVTRSLDRALTLAADLPGRIAISAFGTGIHGVEVDDAARWMSEVFARHPSLLHERDVVLVLWSLGTHRTFFEHFSGLLSRSLEDAAASDAVKDDFIECLADPSAFLFVGSGLSLGAFPRMPSWKSLFPDDWLALLNTDDPSAEDLLLAAQAADDADPGCVKARFLSSVKQAAAPSPTSYQLLALPWSCIITTNYDTLIEDTLRALRLEPVVITTDEELAGTRFAGHRVPVVKIHGGLRGEVASDIIATRDEYDRFFDERPALASFLESRLLTSQGVIVGYSVSDPHLRHLFTRIGRIQSHFREPGARRTTARLFCVTSRPYRVEDYWRRRGMETLVVPFPGGSERVYAQVMNAAVARAHDRIYGEMLPRQLAAADWPTLFGGLDPKQRARLMVALVKAGVAFPPPELLPRDPETERLARAHLSPEQFALYEKKK